MMDRRTALKVVGSVIPMVGLSQVTINKEDKGLILEFDGFSKSEEMTTWGGHKGYMYTRIGLTEKPVKILDVINIKTYTNLEPLKINISKFVSTDGTIIDIPISFYPYAGMVKNLVTNEDVYVDTDTKGLQFIFSYVDKFSWTSK